MALPLLPLSEWCRAELQAKQATGFGPRHVWGSLLQKASRCQCDFFVQLPSEPQIKHPLCSLQEPVSSQLFKSDGKALPRPPCHPVMQGGFCKSTGFPVKEGAISTSFPSALCGPLEWAFFLHPSARPAPCTAGHPDRGSACRTPVGGHAPAPSSGVSSGCFPWTHTAFLTSQAFFSPSRKDDKQLRHLTFSGSLIAYLHVPAHSPLTRLGIRYLYSY